MPARLGGAYRRLLVASAAGDLGDGVVKVALPLLAVQFTGSPAAVAGVALALTLPDLLVALSAGVLADRLDRRRLLLTVDLARVAVLAALAVLAVSGALDGAAGLPALYVAAFTLGAAENVFDTTAQAVLPQVVPPAPSSPASIEPGAFHVSCSPSGA